MTLKRAIIARRAVRTYTTEPVRDDKIEGLKRFLGTLKPLHPEIRVGVSIVTREEFRRSFRTVSLSDAQHYVVLRSAKKDGYLENIGFIGEQIVLYLTQQEVGTCWVGSARAKKSAEAGKLPYVIAISFGRADNAPPRGNAEEANRYLIDDIVMGKISHPSLLPLLDAGRLAPSAMNRQPVRYITESCNLFIYRKRPFLALRSIEDTQRIDVGAAMANIYIQSDCTRVFVREVNYPTPPSNCVYEYTALDEETIRKEEELARSKEAYEAAQPAEPAVNAAAQPQDIPAVVSDIAPAAASPEPPAEIPAAPVTDVPADTASDIPAQAETARPVITTEAADTAECEEDNA